MKYQFQSLDRNADLGDKVKFRSFVFATDDEKVASFVRRNCERHPHFYWEITQEMLQPEVTPEVIYKKKVGRPPNITKVVAGFKPAVAQEGAVE